MDLLVLSSSSTVGPEYTVSLLVSFSSFPLRSYLNLQKIVFYFFPQEIACLNLPRGSEVWY